MPKSPEELFAAALELTDPAERAALLDRECVGNLALRAEVESLLAAQEQAGTFLDKSQSTVVLDISLEKPGDRIDRYKLLEQIGEGGFGTVWMAEQEEPVRRRVALKIIKLGMDTRQVVARFEAERQALALMDHPHIARVFDGGATDTGRPYFVMELVRGVPITEFCEQNKLTIPERLELFMQVCAAVQHAHQKGIIHRDIKPSNVLVMVQDDRPVPKVIDFGVAKATAQRLTDKTMFTRFDQIVGTPAYMSPEQTGANREDIDTRSDIYSLGVLLYELLTGKTPFDTRKLLEAGFEAVLRVIREEEPPKPSTRLTTLTKEELNIVATRRRVAVEKLGKLVRGELDWIVMKALEKERARRYETANGLAMDIRRQVRNEPVTAAAPTLPYRLAKFIRRNRIAFASAFAFGLVLIAGAVVSLWQAWRATHFARDAQTARESEKRERIRAEGRELTTRQHLYGVDMNLAQLALGVGNRQRATMLLERNRPKPTETDLRHWEWRYLWELCQSDELFTLGYHSNVVTCVAFSPDGRLLVSSSYEPAIRVWDVSGGKLLKAIEHDSGVISVAFSPTGKVFASGCGSRVHLWDAHSLQEIGVFDHHGRGFVRAVNFSPDETRLASYDTGGEIKLWNLVTKDVAASLNTSPMLGSLRGALVFSPDGKWLAASGNDGRIGLIDPGTGVPMISWEGHSNAVTALSFAPDSQTLASSSWDHTVRLWRVPSGQGIRTITNHTAWVGGVAFSPDGKTLATAGADQSVRLWDAQTGDELANLQGHLGEVWALAFSADGQLLATGAKDESIKIWSAVPKARAPSGPNFTDAVRWFCFSADNRNLVVLDYQRRLRFVDAISGQQTLIVTDAPTNLTYMMVASAKPLLAWGEMTGTIQLWDVAAKASLRTLRGHQTPVYWLDLTANGTSLVSLDYKRTVKRWDVATGQETASMKIDPIAINNFHFACSPDHRLFAHAPGREIIVINLDSGQHTIVLSGHRENIRRLAFSPDGKTLASAGEDGIAKLWDVTSGREVASLRGHRLGVSTVAFSPDGQRLATGGGEGVVKLWDLATFQEVLTLAVPGSETESPFVEALQFSPDGNSLGAMLRKGQWHVWHPPTFAEIAAAEGGGHRTHQ